jgi:hypothetical protein
VGDDGNAYYLQGGRLFNANTGVRAPFGGPIKAIAGRGDGRIYVDVQWPPEELYLYDPATGGCHDFQPIQGFAMGGDGMAYYLQDGTLYHDGQIAPVASSVQSFALGGDGKAYFLQTNGYLWHDGAPPCPLNPLGDVAHDVQAFAIGGDGRAYILQTTGYLWHADEHGGSLVASSVRLFGVGGDGNLYYLQNGALYNGTLVAAGQPGVVSPGVASFAVGGDARVYFLTSGANPTGAGNLYIAGLPAGQNLVSPGVASFAVGGDGRVYFLTNGANPTGAGNLYIAGLPAGQNLVSSGVASFGFGGNGKVYFLTNSANPTGAGNLYIAGLPAGQNLVSSGVASFGFGGNGTYVLRLNGDLDRLTPAGDIFLTANVRSMGVGADGYVYFLLKDGTLYRNTPQSNDYISGNVLQIGFQGPQHSLVYATGISVTRSSLLGLLHDTGVRITVYEQGSLNPVFTQDYYDLAVYAALDGVIRGAVGSDYAPATWCVVETPDAAGTYRPAQGTLFGAGGVPRFWDVFQGTEGDCWLMASLAEVAARQPAVIQSMFTYNGTLLDNGQQVELYTVRFYNSNGAPVYVTVDTELPDGGARYTRPHGVLWAALAEKAYAEANGAGLVSSQNVGTDSYDALDGGYGKWALQGITGRPATDDGLNPGDVASAWQAGKLIVLDTGSPSSSFIVGNHVYAVVGYNPASQQPFEVFNPWGTDANGWAPGHANTIYGDFVADGNFLASNFDGQTIAGAASSGAACRAGDWLGEAARARDLVPTRVATQAVGDAAWRTTAGSEPGAQLPWHGASLTASRYTPINPSAEQALARPASGVVSLPSGNGAPTSGAKVSGLFWLKRQRRFDSTPDQYKPGL